MNNQEAILVVGASGATGKHVVEQLLENKQQVKVIVRPSASIPTWWESNEKLTIIKASILEIPINDIAAFTKNCQAIICCLGHGTTLKGVFGKPRKLVRDTVQLLCKSVEKNNTDTPVKFVLMNTSGYLNKDENEKISVSQKIVMSLIRNLIPPHLDNELAAEFLRSDIGKNNTLIQWVVVRPDNLTIDDKVTAYELFVSPVTTLFSPRKISRINVAHFMARLVVDTNLWQEWQGKMPVIYKK